ncbi:sulfotransferase family protein [Pontixanthobacter aquaemixtae]|uniref:Sulfotransferase domain-containing protein n=1 Tax=Pontixanthobacter aquaemixtae TaxID=1958940 RepID=A0A844ZQ39_9SPHN|nr:sulfotransferase [Pontixanthobacter aquaemixtae]MXO89664.1 hypothetical protein [Pontixanthobacter aquaemixtae]
MTSQYPNLFLAGAPKCGTTSLYDWLAQHPEIFGSKVKEPIFFRGGLTMAGDLPEADYLSFYDEWDGTGYALDGSTHYFYNPTAPANIKAASPDAKIIIALRNPADAVHSMYHQLSFTGAENLPSLEASLAAEERRAASIAPKRKGIPENLIYSKVYGYQENISRFLETFGESNVRLVLLDDLKDRPVECLRELYQWLGIDPEFAERTELAVKNGAKVPRSRFLLDLAFYPPAWLGKFTKPLFGASTRRKVREMLKKVSTAKAKNPPLNADTRALLLSRFRGDVEWVENFLGRDLTHWKPVPAERPADAARPARALQYETTDG